MVLIVMLLASGPGQPDGDIGDRVELRLCLTGQAHIDEVAYSQDPLPWTTLRVTPDGRVSKGELIRVDDGWAIRRTGSEDDPVWAFKPSILRPGEYASIVQPDGGELIYRIVGVEQDEAG